MWFDDGSSQKACDVEVFRIASECGPAEKLELALLRLGASPDLGIDELESNHDRWMVAQLLRSALDDLKKNC